MKSFLNIEQKKGDPENPHGKLTVYAKIAMDVTDLSSEEDLSPLNEMLKSGFLVAQGNYRDQNSLRDFLQQELGTSLEDEEGMKQFIEGLGGIEGAIDPEKFREKMNQLEELDEFIPTPAKMTHFSSEEQILDQEGDVFFAGSFENSANANLAVNAVTILYQSMYREKQIFRVRGQIDDLISEVEDSGHMIELGEEVAPASPAKGEHISDTILKKFIPDLIHAISMPHIREKAEERLKFYLSNYPQPTDVDKLISLTRVDHLNEVDTKLIELYSYKISYLYEEAFDKVADVVRKIDELESGDSHE